MTQFDTGTEKEKIIKAISVLVKATDNASARLKSLENDLARYRRKLHNWEVTNKQDKSDIHDN